MQPLRNRVVCGSEVLIQKELIGFPREVLPTTISGMGDI